MTESGMQRGADLSGRWAVMAAVWLVLLALPNLIGMPIWPWAQVRQVASRDSLLQLLVLDGSMHAAAVSVLLSLVLLAAIRRFDIFAMLTAPFMVLMPAEAWHVVTYGQPSNAHVFGILTETNAAEAAEFLAGGAIAALAVASIAAVAVAVVVLRARRQEVSWTHRSRYWVLAILIGTTVVAGGATWVSEPAGPVRATAAAGAADVQPMFSEEVSGFADVFPWGLPVRFAEYVAQRRMIASAAGRLSEFRFGATAEPSGDPRTVVLVLGESLRSDRLGLNGYARNTTPELAAIAGLVSFTDAVVATPATRTAVPQILTRARPGSRVDVALDERSIVTAFREAGYATWWISNQMTVGRHDNSIAVLASEAETRRYVNPSSYGGRSAFDSVLVDELRQTLASPARHRFIVVHMLGSHFNYRSRYPDAFDRFQPSLGREEPVTPFDRHKRTQIRNAYDNSILFTDHVLASLIGVLAASGGESVLLFVSDHGQALFEGMCTGTGHGYLSATSFHVPLLVWLSDAARARRPDAQAALEAARRRPVTAESVFPTLIDLAGIRMEGAKRALSLASPGLQTPQRWVTVDLRQWIDYDRDLSARDCARVDMTRDAAAHRPTGNGPDVDPGRGN